jgi:hypothetical protein
MNREVSGKRFELGVSWLYSALSFRWPPAIHLSVLQFGCRQ